MVAVLRCLHACHRDILAYRTLCVYMAAWHLPLHYVRVAREVRLSRAMTMLLAAGMAGAAGGGATWVHLRCVEPRPSRANPVEACHWFVRLASDSDRARRVSLGAVAAHAYLRS